MNQNETNYEPKLHAGHDIDRYWRHKESGISMEIQKQFLVDGLKRRVFYRNAVEVGNVPQPAGLLRQRGNQSRVGMTERIDRNTAAEIEHTPPVLGLKPRALATLESDRRTGERIKECRIAHSITIQTDEPIKNKKCRRAGGTWRWLSGSRAHKSIGALVYAVSNSCGANWGKRG